MACNNSNALSHLTRLVRPWILDAQEISMPSRPIASVTISFGLVAIPVQVFSATESAGQISFNLLHKGCGSRLKQQYVCLKDGELVERSQMVKGFEFAKGQYVEFSPEELKAVEAVGTNSIDIAEFVALDSIEPIYFDKTYYLAPDKGGTKPYALLADALHTAQRFAVGNWSAKGKQHTVALRSVGSVLVMQQLHFAKEVRSIEEVTVPPVELKDAERKLALQLIEQQTSETFDPSAYTDDVRTRIESAVQDKVAGKQITLSETPQPSATNVIDLMDVLRKSIRATEQDKSPEKRAKPAQRKPAQRADAPSPKKAARR
jgi:DNA end-binding protein Ku